MDLKSAFGSNYKALALFRISIGILLLTELILRFRYIEVFYSDEGTLPLNLLMPKIDDLYKIVCVHCMHGSIEFQTLLLSLQVMIACSLIIGYRCQFCAAISWFLYFSLTLRNTWLAFILDRYFHFMLFYLSFLPSGEVWSMDAIGKERNNSHDFANNTVCTVATVAIKLQILWIYLDAGFGKYMDPLQGWTFHADPLPALDTYTRHTVGAQFVYALLGPFGLRVLTPVVVWVEILCAPICIVGTCFALDKVVLWTIGLIVSLHLGIAITLRNTVLLSLVACAAWLTFIPASAFSQIKEDSVSKASKTVTLIEKTSLSKILIPALLGGCLWFETMSDECTQSVKHVYSTLLHNRWNVFIGAEEYVTWEIAPGRLFDGSIVDVWSKNKEVNWNMPTTGAACTSTARHGRWRSFPYLAGLDGADGDALWNYLCKEWNREHPPEQHLLRFNFFMLQADVLPNMGFSATRKRLIHSRTCASTEDDIQEASEVFREIAIEEL